MHNQNIAMHINTRHVILGLHGKVTTWLMPVCGCVDTEYTLDTLHRYKH